MAASSFLFVLAVCLMVQSSHQRMCHKCYDVGQAQKNAKGLQIPGIPGGIQIPNTPCPTKLWENQLTQCEANEVCLKIDYNDGTSNAMRTCGSASWCEATDRSICHTCNSDGCNGASAVSIAMFVLAVPALVWKLC